MNATQTNTQNRELLTNPSLPAKSWRDRTGESSKATGLAEPFRWLALGWRDLRQAPVQSLSFGAIFAIMIAVLHYVTFEQPQLITLVAAATLLVAPFLFLSFYHISRNLESSHKSSLWQAALSWRSNAAPIACFALILGLLSMMWVRITAILFALTVPPTVPAASSAIDFLLGGNPGLVPTAVVALSVVTLGAVLFCLSAYTLPILFHRRVDAIGGIASGLKALRANLGRMGVWAALVVGVASVGTAASVMTLAIIIPLLGHATWHGYRRTAVSTA